ncbi:hypothetical protein RJ639_045255 [Escallonia herrerae]|uniref:Uncharacterized protein n=1 Tax=Escallonia herrerae TaxID=1293975 RepID=A0AA88W7S6_9ASTE|nr:hypothetical protein RJ639_045255 [Escallonia herrerae]
MIGTLSDEFEVNVPAHEAWALYGKLEFTYICVPDLFDKVDVLKGTGALFHTNEDEISKVDDKNMVKEVRASRGGYLSLGFNSYGVRFEVIKKSENSCIIKVTVHYDVTL